MADPLPNCGHRPSPDLEPEHRRAICEGIAERLRANLADDAEPLPSQLEGLVERLAELDGEARSTALDGQDDPASLPLWKRLMTFWQFP
jgi:hypothetical protein